MCQVKRRSFLSLSATMLGGGLVAGKTAHSLQNGGQGAPTGVYHHVHAVSVMTETANRFLAALSSEQRAKATFQFSDDERSDAKDNADAQTGEDGGRPPRAALPCSSALFKSRSFHP